MFIEKTSLIIATRERLYNLKRFFDSINEYINKFNEIIIIDSSSEQIHKKVIEEFSEYKNIFVIKSEASSSLQRNIGIKKFNKNNKYIMFCDDDIIFQKKSILNMNSFINEFPNNIGYGFNLLEKNKISQIDKIKKSTFFMKYGFYHKHPGIVCENGWHTKISNVDRNYKVMWLSTQACIYQSKFINNLEFDISLGKYSYLEDLFLSYELSKRGILSISYNSTYLHPDNINRTSLNFGIIEVTNRYKFVKKNNLNFLKFYITFILKILSIMIQILTLKINLVPKFFGNIFGIILCITKEKK